MTNARWHFNKVRPSQKNREDTQGAFFAANKDIVSSLVRESIQNSLDARLPVSAGPVRVRFFISDGNSELPWADARQFFDDARPHYAAGDSGLGDCPVENTPCRFLVIEDFNTTGLNGRIREYTQPDPATKNSFYSFLRAEGHSNKSHTDRGRWGIGKTVFFQASRTLEKSIRKGARRGAERGAT